MSDKDTQTADTNESYFDKFQNTPLIQSTIKVPVSELELL